MSTCRFVIFQLFPSQFQLQEPWLLWIGADAAILDDSDVLRTLLRQVSPDVQVGTGNEGIHDHRIGQAQGIALWQGLDNAITIYDDIVWSWCSNHKFVGVSSVRERPGTSNQ